jgi:hypothetical protein
MANARLEWTPLGGSAQSYTLPVNFTWDYQELAQDETDRERAVDGTLRSYLRGLKQRWVLQFQFISTPQKDVLVAIKQILIFSGTGPGPRPSPGFGPMTWISGRWPPGCGPGA